MSFIVEVQQGKLKGVENTSVLNGQKYYSFLGIPYAKPPVGDLRFKVSQFNFFFISIISQRST